MSMCRSLALSVLLATAAVDVAPALAMPMAPVAASSRPVTRAAIVCGPYRCVRRFGWRYGYGYGFRRFGFAGPRFYGRGFGGRFGGGGFGFGGPRFGGFRGGRW